jgi:hypothetical protein
MHPPRTSVQFLENIQFPQISNVSRSQSPIPSVTSTPNGHSDLNIYSQLLFRPYIPSQRSFRPKQSDASSPHSSANESAYAAEESLFHLAQSGTSTVPRCPMN